MTVDRRSKTRTERRTLQSEGQEDGERTKVCIDNRRHDLKETDMYCKEAQERFADREDWSGLVV